jgi:hypothetical protein
MGDKRKIFNKKGELIGFNRCQKSEKIPPGRTFCGCGCKSWQCDDPEFFHSKNKSWLKVKGNREKHREDFIKQINYSD